MFGLGVPELIIILVLVLLVFGPRKLPELGSFLGRSLRDFRDSLERREDEGDDPRPIEQADQPGAPSPEDRNPISGEADRPPEPHRRD